MDNSVKIIFFDKINKSDCSDYIDIFNKSNCIDFLEPDNLPFFIAYKNGLPVGALTYLISSYNITPAAAINDERFLNNYVPSFFNAYDYEAEFTAFVIPEERNKGICGLLFEHAVNELSKDFKRKNVKKIVYTLPDYMLKSSWAHHFEYSEYLLKTTKDTFIPADTGKTIENLHKSDSFSTNDIIEVLPTADYQRFDLLINKSRVGCLSVDIAPSRFLLHNVFLSAKLRGMKLGAFLLAETLQTLFSVDNIPVTVNTRSTNLSAVALYKNAGFAIIDQIDFYRYNRI